MNTTPLSHQPETSQQARNIGYMTSVMAVIMIVVTAVFGYLAVQDDAWQLFGITGAAAAYLVIVVASASFVRRQQHTLAAWLCTIGMCSMCPDRIRAGG